MKHINNIKLKTLKQTKKFYLWELKKESLIESERSKYIIALKSINKIIREKERPIIKKSLKNSILPGGAIKISVIR